MNPPPLIPQTANTQKKSWWNRNWKWMVPVLAFVGLAGFASVVLTILIGATSLMKSAEPYKHTVALAKNTPAVVEALGTPIKEGFLPTGSIRLYNSDGTAKLEITLKGPKGEAALYVDAEKKNGVWHYKTVNATFPSNPAIGMIDLTQQANRLQDNSL